MKKAIFILLTLITTGLHAQVAALKGVRLIEVEPGVHDFKIKNEKKAYYILMDLLSECNSYTEIKPPVLSEDCIYGYYLYFNGYDVIYIMKKGGLVVGGIIDKNKRNASTNDSNQP